MQSLREALPPIPEGFVIHITSEANALCNVTKIALRRFLIPYVKTITERSFFCLKIGNSNWASITFSTAAEGQRFLYQFGAQQQPRHFTARYRGLRTQPEIVPLRYLGIVPLFCRQSMDRDGSIRVADPVALRHLQREERLRIERSLTVHNGPDTRPFAKNLPVEFRSTAIWCGAWKYVQEAPSFSPQAKVGSKGVTTFGLRSVKVTLDSSLRMDIHYNSIENFTAADGPHACFVFTLSEPPRFQELITPRILESMKLRGTPLPDPNAQWNRIPYASQDHSLVVGSCLVYCITLATGKDTNETISDKIQQLRGSRAIPEMLARQVNVIPPNTEYIDGSKTLMARLEDTALELSWEMKFQIQKLAQNAYLSPRVVLALIPEIQKMPARTPISVCINALRKLFFQIPFAGPHREAADLEFDAIVGLLRENEEAAKREYLLPIQGSGHQQRNSVIIHRAKVTPCTTHLSGPEPEPPNRILRKYSDHHSYFLRVNFCDENGSPLQFNRLVSNKKMFWERYSSVMKDGIQIAGRLYMFLAFSGSSLRGRTCWFVAPFVHNGSLLYEQHIIRGIGNFTSERIPAKCAARIGQAFSDTPVSVPLGNTVIQIVPDVKRNGFVFSDGCGTMSRKLMEKIWNRLSNGQLVKPTCFQIRCGGAKGMISLDPLLEGDVLCLRNSMIKFQGSEFNFIEICLGGHKALSYMLNKQMIKILEDMGVEDSYFLDLQARELHCLRQISDDPINACTFLEYHRVGENMQLPWLIKKLHFMNLNYRQDPFLNCLVDAARMMEVREIKYRGRLRVPMGYHLYGLMDETGILEEGEIFCVVLEDGCRRVIIGNDLMITRAPQLFPGDIQLVNAVHVPPGSPLLEHHNCIFFSQKGGRDLPNMLSGGDLDGDQYYISWDPGMKPKRVFPPANFPKRAKIEFDHAVTSFDMAKFFIHFMEQDLLGPIATSHVVESDLDVLGTNGEKPLRLAALASHAVDFPKTGNPINMSELPAFGKIRPDHMAPGPWVVVKDKELLLQQLNNPAEELEDEDDGTSRYDYYDSHRINGRLYREVDEAGFLQKIEKDALLAVKEESSSIIATALDWVLHECHGLMYDHHLGFARELRTIYEESIHNIRYEYSDHPTRPITELEVISGNIFGREGAPDRRKRELSMTLKERADEQAAQIVGWIKMDGEEDSPEALEKSIACLVVSLEPHDSGSWHRGERLVSFKYLAAAVCLREVGRLVGR